MRRNRLDSGKHGEERAEVFLKEQGFEILQRNYRYKRAEIDIIARKPKLLVFVEVKLRTKVNYGNPEESVGAKKEALVLMAAENYIFEIDWKGDIRFDVISILGEKELIHFEDAFG